MPAMGMIHWIVAARSTLEEPPLGVWSGSTVSVGRGRFDGLRPQFSSVVEPESGAGIDGRSAEGGRSVAEETVSPSDPTEGADTQKDHSNRGYTPPPVSRKPLGCLVEIAETLILTIIIFWLIQTFVAQPYRVEQESMRTTLEPDQYVLVDKLTPRFDDYSRGDIVVFNAAACGHRAAKPSRMSRTSARSRPTSSASSASPGTESSCATATCSSTASRVNEPYVHGVDTRPLSGETAGSSCRATLRDGRQPR